MADTTVSSANQMEQWADNEFMEYVRASSLSGLMGSDENSCIQVREDLTKKSGDKLTFSLVSRLTGAGVTGDNSLSGNEEALGNHGMQVTINTLRHGVVIGQHEQIKSQIDLLNAARGMLKLWNMEQLRDLFIARLLSPVTDGVTTYAAATEAQKDAWAVANNPALSNQRILYGSAKSNSSGDHSADLAKVDSTNDDLSDDIVRLTKRMAQTCDPHIRPVKAGPKDQPAKEYFVYLAGSVPFRDLEANFETTLQYAGERGDGNRLFSAGDLLIGNVLVKEEPRLDSVNTAGGSTISGVGDTASDVQACFLMGAQALGLAWGSRMEVKTDSFDYDQRRGVAVREVRGCAKLTYNSFQHGVVTNYVSAVAD